MHRLLLTGSKGLANTEVFVHSPVVACCVVWVSHHVQAGRQSGPEDDFTGISPNLNVLRQAQIAGKRQMLATVLYVHNATPESHACTGADHLANAHNMRHLRVTDSSDGHLVVHAKCDTMLGLSCTSQIQVETFISSTLYHRWLEAPVMQLPRPTLILRCNVTMLASGGCW